MKEIMSEQGILVALIYMGAGGVEGETCVLTASPARPHTAVLIPITHRLTQAAALLNNCWPAYHTVH